MVSLKSALISASIRAAKYQALQAAKAYVDAQIKALKDKIADELTVLEGRQLKTMWLTGRITNSDLKRRFLHGSPEARAAISKFLKYGEVENASRCIKYIKQFSKADFDKMVAATIPTTKTGRALKEGTEVYEKAKRHFLGAYHSIQSHYSTEFLGKVAKSCGKVVPVHSNGKYMMSPDIMLQYLNDSNQRLSDAAHLFLYTNAERYSKEYNLTFNMNVRTVDVTTTTTFGDVEFITDQTTNTVYARYSKTMDDFITGAFKQIYHVDFSLPISSSVTYGKEYYQYVADVVREKGMEIIKERVKRLEYLAELKLGFDSITFSIKNEFEDGNKYTAYSESDDWNINPYDFNSWY